MQVCFSRQILPSEIMGKSNTHYIMLHTRLYIHTHTYTLLRRCNVLHILVYRKCMHCTHAYSRPKFVWPRSGQVLKITSLTEHCGLAYAYSEYAQRIMMHGASIHTDNGLSVVHVTVKQGLLITCMPT